jgi:hypothetical protein
MNEQDLYFNICLDFIVKMFGKNPGIDRGGRSFLTTNLVTPADGGHVCRFNTEELKWEDWDQSFTGWSIVQDGKVFVSYPEDEPMDGGMFFKVGHPREVCELLNLMVQPVSYFGREVPPSQPRKLGDLMDFYALLPSGSGWKALNFANLPPNMTEEFKIALGCNLVQNRDALISGKSCEASKFGERWPELVGTLPDAAPLLRTGYLVDKYLNLLDPLDLLMQTSRNNAPFLNMLLVPSRSDVSALYLREYLNGDAKAAKQLREAFADENDVNIIQANLSDVLIHIPVDLFDQIQLAAQTNLMRNQLMQQAETLAYGRAPFDQLATRYRDAGRAMEALKI